VRDEYSKITNNSKLKLVHLASTDKLSNQNNVHIINHNYDINDKIQVQGGAFHHNSIFS
jgi:hypothetical protein